MEPGGSAGSLGDSERRATGPGERVSAQGAGSAQNLPCHLRLCPPDKMWSCPRLKCHGENGLVESGLKKTRT